MASEMSVLVKLWIFVKDIDGRLITFENESASSMSIRPIGWGLRAELGVEASY